MRLRAVAEARPYEVTMSGIKAVRVDAHIDPRDGKPVPYNVYFCKNREYFERM